MFDQDNITPEWLTSVLRNNGFLGQDTITKIHIKRSIKRGPPIFFFKITPSNSVILDKISRSMALKLNDFSNEGRFYRFVKDRSIDLPIPQCYNLYELEQKKWNCLLLDDLSETYENMGTIDPPSKTRCEMAISSLVKIHATFWDHSDLEKIGPEGKTLAYMSKEFKKKFPTLLNSVLEFLDSEISKDCKEIYNIVFSRFPYIKFSRMNLRKHITLTHGDAWLGNFLLPKQNQNSPYKINNQVKIIDWETWSVGFGPNDLAHMIGLNWNPKRRKSLELDLVKYYHRELAKNGIQDYSWKQCWYDYRLGIIGELLTPIIFCYWKFPPEMWRYILNCSYQSFKDLNCLDIITEGR